MISRRNNQANYLVLVVVAHQCDRYRFIPRTKREYFFHLINWETRSETLHQGFTRLTEAIFPGGKGQC